MLGAGSTVTRGEDLSTAAVFNSLVIMLDPQNIVVSLGAICQTKMGLFSVAR